mmetsp:Transcript_45531/g.131906  ORF Transcript_45531/g.131906 Transcript_45531/m.131906 type:complete len:205 (+) Transcript_45531:434-1048(+)
MELKARPFSRDFPEDREGASCSWPPAAARGGGTKACGPDFGAAFFFRSLGSFGACLACSMTIVALSTLSSSPSCSKSSLAPSAHFLHSSPSCIDRCALATFSSACASRCLWPSLTLSCRACSACSCPASPSSLSTQRPAATSSSEICWMTSPMASKSTTASTVASIASCRSGWISSRLSSAFWSLFMWKFTTSREACASSFLSS